MTPDLVLHIIVRFIHISSVILLLGGIFYAWQVSGPLLNTLPENLRVELATASQLRFRGPLFTLVALIVGSGLYNFLTGPHHGREYQIWIGIKMLLVLHIAAVSIIWVTSPHGDVTVGGKSKRRLVSLGIVGLVIVAISAYLRSLTLRGL